MISKKPSKTNTRKAHMDSESRITPDQSETTERRKSGKLVANPKTGTLGKNSAGFWASRIFKGRNDDGIVSPHYIMRVQFKGKRTTFTTGTGNKEAAAKIAAGIYNDILVMGWDAAQAKHRPRNESDLNQPPPVTSVGDWITAARKVSEANESTFTSYSRALRKIVADILAVEKSKKRFGPKKGGAEAYRAKIDATSLEILTLPAVQKWRLEYAKQAKTPAEERSRMTSCNSTIRQARSLFAAKIIKFLPDLRLPSPIPFHEVEFF
ncbi:MAG: hypothetical protein ACKOHM_07785, partial [Spartobacteria bacterium]